MNNFNEMTMDEIVEVEAGGVTAAVYALGFVMGCPPAAALGIVGGVVVAGAAAAYYLS